MHFSLKPGLALPAILAVVASLTLPLAALADDDDGTATAGVGVARLSVVDGSVAIQRGDSNTTVDAVVNAPVLGADYVTTGAQSRAELQFDGTTVVRLGEDVQMRVSRIDQNDRQLQLAAGTIDLRLLRGTDGSNAIDTPSISVVPQTAGSYRIAVDAQGTTFVTVRSGHAEITAGNGSQELDPGTTLVAEGPASDPHVSNRAEIAADAFDDFNAQRDQNEQSSLAQNPYVNGNIDGVSDLNAYGRWADDGSYGHVWIPSNVGADWAPYRDGNWTWEDNYGWTWVGAEPWGWAPYHYGRWYYSTAYSRWAWYPPAAGVAVPAWSPALVGFIGLSIGAVNIGIGFGNVGWVPLAPYEAFHPWWGRGASVSYNNVTINHNVYVNNTTYNGNITHVYRNAQYNGVTSVSAENFRAGRFNGATAVPARELANAHPVPVRGALPVVPTASNLRFTQSEASHAPVAVRTAEFSGRTFAGRPTVTERTPFVQQQAAVARVAHVALPADARTSTNDYTRSTEAAGYARPAERAPTYSGPASASAMREPAATTRAPGAVTTTGDPWSRFNTNRGANPTSPSYARPQTSAQSSYGRAAAPEQRSAAPSYGRADSTTYARPATPSYNRPDSTTYARPATPSYGRADSTTYARPASPSYGRSTTSGYDRSAGASYPSYGRQAEPAYSRPAASSGYDRSGGTASPSYGRQAAPSYGRQQSAAPARGESAPPAHGAARGDSHQR